MKKFLFISITMLFMGIVNTKASPSQNPATGNGFCLPSWRGKVSLTQLKNQTIQLVRGNGDTTFWQTTADFTIDDMEDAVYWAFNNSAGYELSENEVVNRINRLKLVDANQAGIWNDYYTTMIVPGMQGLDAIRSVEAKPSQQDMIAAIDGVTPMFRMLCCNLVPPKVPTQREPDEDMVYEEIPKLKKVANNSGGNTNTNINIVKVYPSTVQQQPQQQALPPVERYVRTPEPDYYPQQQEDVFWPSFKAGAGYTAGSEIAYRAVDRIDNALFGNRNYRGNSNYRRGGGRRDYSTNQVRYIPHRGNDYRPDRNNHDNNGGNTGNTRRYNTSTLDPRPPVRRNR